MSSVASFFRPPLQFCECCDKQTFDPRQKRNCEHKVCDTCVLTGKMCQSDCPLCCYRDSVQFIYNNKICSVCCSGIRSGDGGSKCHQDHLHCSSCSEKGCILCEFLRLKVRNTITTHTSPKNLQRVLYACDIWQRKGEQSSKSKLSDHKSEPLKKKESSLMETKTKGQPVSSFLSPKDKKKSEEKEESDNCTICLEPLGSSYHTLDVCKHSFHKPCIDQWYESSGKQSCPTCGHVYGFSKGPQPLNGQMKLKYHATPLPGFEKDYYKFPQKKTTEISYSFPSGTQGSLNPNPGKPYSGTSRVAYLPNNKEGYDILCLLRKAFQDQHVFTIGRSTTTGQDNVVTWNDIHHKTSIHGGPQSFGYPDPTYLHRIREELADKGYK